ncbi:MAG: sugar ABC transporter ATP-binding protein [Actinomycetota bacterium]|nr:sugar ABC transporter ATP-binding protein [Actinomycetota bacterium]
MSNKKFLIMKNISKSFPGTVALKNVDFEINKGEIIGLIGENGAGKSTLVNIISGALSKDSGELYIEGEKVSLNNPLAAKNKGIVTIHQELSLFSNMNVAENIFMGNEKAIFRFFLNRRDIFSKSSAILENLGLKIKPSVLVKDLSVAQRQLVEIARALVVNARLVVMDEPTSSLMSDEITMLIKIINKLKKNGVSIIFVTHKLDEIINYTDKATVLRDGKLVGTVAKEEYCVDKLINMMVGKKLDDFYIKKEKKIVKENSFEVRNLSTIFLENINFSVKKGEILALAGPVGAGRTEIMRAIYGIDRKKTGSFFINNKEVEINNPFDAIKAGIGFVPEDRKLQGLIIDMTVRSNVTLPILKNLNKLGWINTKKENSVVNKFIKRLSIKVNNSNQILKSLSGGNQQKVSISKWLAIRPKVLLLDEPTRGIDVGAKQEIYNIINNLSQEGISIIIISSELEETIKISDRIVILYNGKVKGEIDSNNATQGKILKIAHC